MSLKTGKVQLSNMVIRQINNFHWRDNSIKNTVINSANAFCSIGMPEPSLDAQDPEKEDTLYTHKKLND